MNISDKIKIELGDMAYIIRDEFRTISTSYAILLVLTGGIFLYGLLYNYMYAPDVVRKAPVAVADYSHSRLSREYVQLLNATEQVEVVAEGIGFPEARQMMKTDEAIGIVYIPWDFEDRINRGEQAIFIVYETTTAFLYYMTMQEATSGAMLALNERCRPDMVVFLPQSAAVQLTSIQPITVVGTALYNHTEGYGSYLIPAVLMVIIFQTLMMLVGMISGEERHTGSLVRFAVQGCSFGRVSRIILSKTFVYTMLYTIFSLFLLGLIPILFDLPRIGHLMNTVRLMIPFLMATSFLGLAASIFFTDGDAPLLMIAFFSVGLIFLSGVSYPLELMPWYWKAAHYVFPAAPATLAYVKLNSMGASMAEIRTEYLTLWIQCIVYFLLACFSYRHTIRLAYRPLIRKEGRPPARKTGNCASDRL